MPTSPYYRPTRPPAPAATALMSRDTPERRTFPGKRWLNVGLRTVHLAALLLFGSALLGQGDPSIGLILLLSSGGLMFVLDCWANPAHLRELAGLGTLLKLALLGLGAWQRDWLLPLFWVVLVLSTVLSHAPGPLRHRRLG